MTFPTQGVANNFSETFCIGDICNWSDITVNVHINNVAALVKNCIKNILLKCNLNELILKYFYIIREHEILVYADDVNTFGGNIHNVKENTEILVVARKEIGLEVNAEKTNCMVMCGDQNAGRSHNTKNDNSSYERVEDLKYLETTLTDQHSLQEEINSRLNSGNSCCHSMQKLLSSSLLSRTLKNKIYRTVILPVILYGCET